MRNRNAVKRALLNSVISAGFLILAACGQNPGGNYGAETPIQPAMADTAGSSLDLTIPLDVAVVGSNPRRFAVRGKYIAIDPGSTGQANLRLSSISDTPRLAYPGAVFNPGNFTDLYFDYTAQPGKFLHVIYGDSPDILNSGNKTALDPALPRSTYFNSQANVTGSINIVTAAQNINGIKIYGGKVFITGNGVGAAGTVYGSSSLLGAQFLASAAAVATVGNPVGLGVDTVPVLYVPPGFALQWSYSSNVATVGGGTLATIFLNYEVL